MSWRKVSASECSLSCPQTFQIQGLGRLMLQALALQSCLGCGHHWPSLAILPSRLEMGNTSPQCHLPCRAQPESLWGASLSPWSKPGHLSPPQLHRFHFILHQKAQGQTQPWLHSPLHQQHPAVSAGTECQGRVSSQQPVQLFSRGRMDVLLLKDKIGNRHI